MPFYTFRQNNSGGSFCVDKSDGIDVMVIVEANSHEHANERAEEIGLYFDGCSTGNDCKGCGDRWSRAWKEDGTEWPSSYGTRIPLEPDEILRAKLNNETIDCDPGYVHYLDGRVVQIPNARRGI